MMQPSKTLIGAALGAATAVLLLVFGFGGLLLIAILSGVGFAIGMVVERPEAVGQLLERSRSK